MKIKLLSTIVFLGTAMIVNAQFGEQQSSNQPSLRGNGMQFTENKGQIVDMNDQLRLDILFVGDGGGMNVYLRKTGISYVLAKYEGFEEDEKDLEHLNTVGNRQLTSMQTKNNTAKTIKLHRIDMDFVDCNPNPTLLKQDEVEGYTNYYYDHCPNGITNVKGYNKIIYQNIYPNIDIIYYGSTSLTTGSGKDGSTALAKGFGLKYDIVVRPGGNPNDIKIKYAGQDDIEVQDSKFKVQSSLGDIFEEMPRVYQNINGKIVDVKAEYVLNGTTLNLKLSNYQTNLPLIIDPWATYYGGSSSDYGTSIATDNAGNVVITGNTNSANFPAMGGSQMIYGGGFRDAFIAKFTSTGTLVWASYYGGSADDNSTDIATDLNGNVVITGHTISSNLPVWGGFQMTWGGAGLV